MEAVASSQLSVLVAPTVTAKPSGSPKLRQSQQHEHAFAMGRDPLLGAWLG